MKRLAHRGYSAYYPENTMMAFIKAYEKGFDGIETDVHMSKDGELVLIHDEKINRTSNGKGYVKDYTLEELRQWNYGYRFSGKYEIPTLYQLLSWIKDKDFIVNIEIKTDVIHYTNIEKKVVEMVHQLGVESQVYYSSFYLPSVLKLKQLDEKAYVGYLIEKNYKQKYKELIDHQIKAFHPRYNFLTLQRVQDLKQHHIQIASWTIPSQNEFDRMKNLDIDFLISNDFFK